jgi:hypothetical protein
MAESFIILKFVGRALGGDTNVDAARLEARATKPHNR